MHNIVLAFWETEEMPTEWETGLLKILPKKGDKSDPANYRGIMLLEVAYKIVANIVHMRLQVILESQVKKERKKENRQPKGGMGGRHAATTQGF